MSQRGGCSEAKSARSNNQSPNASAVRELAKKQLLIRVRRRFQDNIRNQKTVPGNAQQRQAKQFGGERLVLFNDGEVCLVLLLFQRHAAKVLLSESSHAQDLVPRL
jgi:hypothetical protein